MKSEEKGFSFILRNCIAYGTIIEVFYLKVNTIEVPFNQIEIEIEGKRRTTHDITDTNPVLLVKGRDTKFIVHYANTLELGQTLTIELSFKVKEIGTMKFDFSDQFSN